MASSSPARVERARAPLSPEGRRSQGARRARLAVLGARDLAARSARRRARVLTLLAALILAAALFVVAAAQTVVDAQQLKIDNLEQQATTAANENANLQLQRAELESPVRILELAQRRLGLVSPAHVVYLSPVPLGRTVGQAARPGVS